MSTARQSRKMARWVSLSRSVPWESVLMRCVLTFFLSALVILLQLALYLNSESRIFFIWYPFIYLISLYWGLWPGLIATTLSAFAVEVFFTEGFSPFSIQGWSEASLILTFFMVGLIISFGNQRNKKLQRELSKELLARAEAQHKSNQLGAIVEKTHDVIFLVTEDGHVTYLNEAGKKSLRFRGDEQIHWSQIILLPSSVLRELRPSFALPTLVKTGEFRAHLIQEQSSRLIPVALSVFPIGEHPLHYAFVCRDLRTENRLKSNLEAVREHIPITYWQYQFSTGGVETDLEFSKVTNSLYPIRELEDFQSIFSQSDYLKLTHFILHPPRPGRENDNELEMVCRTSHGNQSKWLYVVVVIERSHKGDPLQANGLFLDVTKAKESEERLQQALKMRDNFFAVASHELKTPISSLSLQIELLKEVVLHQLKDSSELESVQDMLKDFQAQYRRLAALVNDFLDVSRITSGKMTVRMSPFSLSHFVDATVKLFSESAQLEIVPPEVPPVTDEVSGDEERMRQVLINLISNAVKFGQGKKIEITWGVDHRQYWIQVRDHGVGMSPEECMRVFDQYEQAAAGKEKAGGLGLGLYISKEIVRAHGGFLTVQSKPQYGSTFRIEIPVRPTAKKEGAAPSQMKPAAPFMLKISKEPGERAPLPVPQSLK